MFNSPSNDGLFQNANSICYPIIGFGYSLATGVIKSIQSDGFLGIFLGGTTATAGGIAAAILFGYIMSVVFTPKAKP